MMKGVAAPPVTAINAAHATPPITVFAMFLGDENIFVKDFTTPLKMLFTDSPNESLPSSFPSSFDARSDDVIDLMPSCELVEFVEVVEPKALKIEVLDNELVFVPLNAPTWFNNCAALPI